MALAITSLIAEGDPANASTYTSSGSASPAASCGLIWVIDESSATLTGDPTLTTGFTISGSWTKELDSARTGHRVLVYSAKAAASPGSGTIQTSWGASRTGQIQALIQITDQDGTDFVLQPKIDNTQATGTTASLSLDSALGSSSNAILGITAINNNEVMAFTGGESEIVDVGHASPNRRLHVGYQINDTNVADGWTNAATQIIQAVLEIVQATGGGGGGDKPKTLLTLGVG